MIPLGGNAFITRLGNPDSPEVVTDRGLQNWMDPDSICSIFFKMESQWNPFPVSLRLKVVPSGSSLIRVWIPGRESYDVRIEGAESYIQHIGIFSARVGGYIQLNLQGISKEECFFGDVFELILSNIQGEVIYISDPELFYFGRRGPSVHINYNPKTEKPLEYFYNEVTVPVGQDVIGSYFASSGFMGGYFGIQVNSATERRVLFSVWSDWDTDNPEEIPEEYRVKLLKKGEAVTVQDFGNEGSGKQSFLKYNWKANETYEFLIFGRPMDIGSTTFTTWFRPSGSEWKLIASFRKPKVETYLRTLYSFSENFSPSMGFTSREVQFGNQWVRTADGFWMEVLNGIFTGDYTSRNGRDDFAGGVTSGSFFLKNCGFFDEKVETNVEFNRLPTNRLPVIDIQNLP